MNALEVAVREGLSGHADWRVRTRVAVVITGLAVAATLAVAGLGASAAAAVADDLDNLRAQRLELTPPPDSTLALDAAIDRLLQLPPIRAATWVVIDQDTVAAVMSGTGRRTRAIRVAHIGPSARTVVDASLEAGVWPTETDQGACVLGRATAKRLNIHGGQLPVQFQLGGREATCVGIVGTAALAPELLDTIWVFEQPVGAWELWARTSPGAAASVAQRARIMIAPGQPSEVAIRLEQDVGKDLQAEVLSQLGSLTLGVAAAAGLLSSLAIGVTSWLGVTRRTEEIGLRRALGATTRLVSLQLVIEAVYTGIVGASWGVALGTTVTLLGSIALGWTARLPLSLIMLELTVGAVAGVVGGVVAARAAARVEPASALRGS